ncbi:GntR family transcriptional regulator [Streptomyces sp. NPDC058464]|uniref:GntR family transcriptional regulator n=1 Tax=Streptomyces sp. NPDC058464 TaxID=3346511 RepID=UPI00365AF8A5
MTVAFRPYVPLPDERRYLIPQGGVRPDLPFPHRGAYPHRCLPVGARLPAERELAEKYAVAINTARRAVRELRDQGLVITVPIKCTFVQVQEPYRAG